MMLKKEKKCYFTITRRNGDCVHLSIGAAEDEQGDKNGDKNVAGTGHC